jgi:hypothetical protein
MVEAVSRFICKAVKWLNKFTGSIVEVLEIENGA